MKLTPITNPVALRRDTTVGTRIFTGDTMIHGDTGMRTVLEFGTNGVPSIGTIPSGWTPIAGVSGGIRWRRVGEEVFLYLRGLRAANTSSQIDIPTGFATSGLPYHTITITSDEGLIPAKAGAFQVSITAPRGGFPFPDVYGTYWSAATWRTRAPWPTTLPGLPA